MNYASPVFVSIVLYAIYILLAAAVGLTIWSAVRGLRRQKAEDGGADGIRQRRIVIGIALLLAVTLAVTWLSAGTDPLTINGKTYSDVFWLRTSGMMINTAIVLIAVIVALMLYIGAREISGKTRKEER